MKSYTHNVDYIIRKCPTLSIKDRISLLYRISLGLCFLYSKNVIHRDFKPQNIVVNSALTPHIIDFGSCCSVYSSSSFSPYDKRRKILLKHSPDNKVHSHLLSRTSIKIPVHLLKDVKIVI